MKYVNKLIIALSGLIAIPMVGYAQMPRVQTSAPAEKTTVPLNNTPEQKQAPAKITKPTEKSDKSSNGLQERYMAVKTNIAYDALAVLNLSYEIQVAPKWSVEIPVMWSLWDWNTDKGLRTVTLQPGVKYCFNNPGQGHAIGADFIAGWFNMRYNEKRYQDCGRPMLGASLNYSYTLPIGRGWAAEFALGVGYVNMSYNTYYNIDNGAWISKNQRNYFGPTRIGISLSYKL